jgi:hypothetical protein
MRYNDFVPGAFSRLCRDLVRPVRGIEGESILLQSKGAAVMKIKDGDQLIGKAGEYDIELTVTKVCKGDVCWTECEADLQCDGQPMMPIVAGNRLTDRRPRQEPSRSSP